jgi:fibronectin-binding autotransporter adhesin
MAYKVSFGDYSHSGSLTATSDLSGTTNVSGATGTFGALSVTTFNPASISTTTLTATGVTTLSGNVFLGDASADIVTVNGQITGSLFAITGGTINNTTIGATTQSTGKFTSLSASSTLDVVGVTKVTTLSASTGVSSSVGQFGTLSSDSFNPASISTTSLTATTGSFTRLAGTAFTNLSNNFLPFWDSIDGVLVNSFISRNVVSGTTTISGSGGLLTHGTLSVVGGAVSSSVGVSGNVGQFGTLTVGTFSPTNLTVTNDLIVSGNTTLGNTNTDILAVTAKVSTSIVPTGSADLGGTGAGNQWANLYATNISSSGNVTIGGNLTVNGTTTTVNSTTLEITDLNILIASGAASTSLANGAGISLGSPGGYQFNFQSSSLGETSNFWQVSGSSGLMDFKAKTVFATLDGNVTQQTKNVGDASGTMALGINFTQADFTAPRTWTLPASPNQGHSVKVKAPHNCSISNTLTISASAGAIDFTGNTVVVLSSPDAAVELVYVDKVNNLWKMF